MKIKHRIHEWAANKFTFVQYPNIRPALHRIDEKSNLTFTERGLLLIFGLAMGAIGLIAFVVGLFILYVLLSA